MIKKKSLFLVTMMLVLSLFFVPTATFAQTATDHQNQPTYYDNGNDTNSNNNNSNIVAIEGHLYEFTDTQVSSNEAIQIKDLKTGHTDLVYKIDSNVYLNGEIVGTIETETTKVDSNTALYNDSMLRASSWKKVGSRTKRVSWKKGVSVAVVAVIIGSALGKIGGAAIIASTGVGAISVIAGASIGGKVKYTLYKSKVGKYTRYKWHWRFIATTGEKFGPYNTYSTV